MLFCQRVVYTLLTLSEYCELQYSHESHENHEMQFPKTIPRSKLPPFRRFDSTGVSEALRRAISQTKDTRKKTNHFRIPW